MNQIAHFEFIGRNVQIIGLLSWLIAASIVGRNCVAQNWEPRPNHSKWIVGDQAADGSLTPTAVPPVESSIVETSFSTPVTPSPSPSAPQTEPPTANQADSTLSNITQYLASQTKKLFGSSAPGNGPDFKRIFGSLSLVLGCYFALVWMLRMISPPSNRPLPNEVVEVLGKTPFGHRQHLQLVRIGSRLLLLLESNETIQPIAEVSDPEEVHQLLTLCEPNSREYQRKRSKPARSGLSASQAHPQVQSLRIPAVNSTDSDRNSIAESEQATLANLIRVFENATGKNSSRYKNSYEA